MALWESKTLDLPLLLPEGRECDLCVDRLRAALLRIAGVRSADVDPSRSRLVLTYDPSLLSLDHVERSAEQIGVDITRRIQHDALPVTGMDCPDCALKIEKGVQRLPGVLSAQVNFTAARMLVEFEAPQVGRGDLVRRIESLGYAVGGPEASAESRSLWMRWRAYAATAGAGLFLLLGFVARAVVPENPIVADALFGLALASGGYPLARTVPASLRAFTFDTNFLMLLAAVGAAAIGDWSEGAMVMALYSLGNSLESLTMERTRRSIRAMLTLAPETAHLVDGDHEHDIPARDVRPGQLVRVKPGDKTPVDGVVEQGESSVSEAAITGESLPVAKGVGSTVYAGTMNGDGALLVRSTRLPEETTLGKILHLVEEAQARKAPAQRFTERFGRVYTPLVIVAAVITGLVWPLAFGLPFALWFHRALTFLVVACPCALVISAPVAVAAAIGRAARQGVLTKGGAALEALGGVRCVAFDKTGTLTTGRLSVTDVVPAPGFCAEETLGLAAAVEVHSQHPIAQATLERAAGQGIALPPSEGFRSVPGRGAVARVNGATVRVGSRAYLEAEGVSTDSLAGESERLAGKATVWVARDGVVAGALTVKDTVRPEARDTVERLRAAGVRHLVMLTGDDEATARAVAATVGVDETRANLLPEQKVDAVRDLLRRYGSVAMVGDGVNDAPALAAATVGVAMGAVGSDVAMETADVVLMGDDLTRLPYAVHLSRRMLGVIRQNIVFAFAVVLALVSGILFDRIGLAAGVLGHEGSALLVIFNGMRLLRNQEKNREAL